MRPRPRFPFLCLLPWLCLTGLAHTATAQTGCAYSIQPASLPHPADGYLAPGYFGGMVTVSTAAGCAWSATTTDTWIQIGAPSSGAGNGMVFYSVMPNTASTSRTGAITIAGQKHTVIQAGKVSGCTYSFSPASASVSAAQQNVNVTITTASACYWDASGDAVWISFPNYPAGIGSGTLTFTVQANTGSSSRSGTLTIAGQTYQVTQAGAGGTTCTYSLSPTSASASAAATTGSVAVTATSGCSWTAASNTGWISITSGASGSGNGAVGYSVAANTGASSRTGTLTIGGQTFTVTQAAATAPPPSGGTPGISEGGVVNAADFTPNFAPGMIISIFGENLASSLQASGSSPLPTTLNGTSVQAVIGSQTVTLPLFFVSSGQVNAQLPFAVSPGTIGIQVRTAAGVSAAAPITIQARSPGLFTVPSGGTGPAALLHANYDVITDQSPANPGEWLVVYLTGLGAVSPAVAPGQAAGDGAGLGPLSRVTDTVTVTVNGSPAQVYFAGLAPKYAGLYQVNFKVPDDAQLGPAQIVVTVAGSSSQSQVTFQTSLNWSAPAVKTIGPAGGTVSGSHMSVTVPAGALASAQDLKVYESTGPAPNAAERLGPVFRLEGLPATTSSPITVSVQLSGSTAPAQGTYLVLEEPRGGQILVPATVSGSQLTATLPARKGAPASSPAAASGKAMASRAAGNSNLAAFLVLWIATGVHNVTSPMGYFDVLYSEISIPTVSANKIIAKMEGALDSLIRLGYDDKIGKSLPIQVRFLTTLNDQPTGVSEFFGGVTTVKWTDQRVVRLAPDYLTYWNEESELKFYPDWPKDEILQAKAAHLLFHYVQELYDADNRQNLRDQNKLHPWAWWDEATALVFEKDPSSFIPAPIWEQSEGLLQNPIQNQYSSGPENSSDLKSPPDARAYWRGVAYSLFLDRLLWNSGVSSKFISRTYRSLDSQGSKLLPSQAMINELGGSTVSSAWLDLALRLASGKAYPSPKEYGEGEYLVWCPFDSVADLAAASNWSKAWLSPDLSAYTLMLRFLEGDRLGSTRAKYNNPGTRVHFAITGGGKGYLWNTLTRQLVTLGSEPLDVPYTDQMWGTTPFYLLVANPHVNQTQPHSDGIWITVEVKTVPQNRPAYMTFKWWVPALLPGNPGVTTIFPEASITACPPYREVGSLFCGPIYWNSELEFSFTSANKNVSLNGRLSATQDKLEYFHIDLKNVEGQQYWFTHGVSITLQNIPQNNPSDPSDYLALFGDLKNNFARYVTEFTYTLTLSKDGSPVPGSPFHLGVGNFNWSDVQSVGVQVNLLR